MDDNLSYRELVSVCESILDRIRGMYRSNNQAMQDGEGDYFIYPKEMFDHYTQLHDKFIARKEAFHAKGSG